MGPPAQPCRRAWGLPNPPPSVPRGGPELQTAESMPAPVSPPLARSALHGTPSPESMSDSRPRPLGDTASVPPSFECFRLYSTSLRPTGSLPDSGRRSVAAAHLALQTARRLRAMSPGHCSLSPSKVSGHELLWGLSRGLPNASVRGGQAQAGAGLGERGSLCRASTWVHKVTSSWAVSGSSAGGPRLSRGRLALGPQG